ncbi:MAG: protein-(glutamine-N5) methyltransferase, release factor-specific [Ponticaulis sp.]|nr:protein-(glutamine-N5) methyltransferase, release factor-specific [Ponticaulis sp.]|tara:strand:+ start:3251 stop:4114 length:864 start_codon:yes stop_codon:yes gene_type:complete
MTDNKVTVWRSLRVGRARLEQANIPNADFEASLLFQHVTGWSREMLIEREGETVSAAIQSAFDALIVRRLAREPISAILGDVEFMGFRFVSDSRALTPRMDSERLVEAALKNTKPGENGFVLDLGTGSGCLLLSFLLNRPGWRGVGVDASADAISLMEENTKLHGLQGRAFSTLADWKQVGFHVEEADIVISNPPYIRTKTLETLDPEVRNHDPMQALDGGEDGLDAYREIAELCDQKMKPDALLFLEIGYDQGVTVTELLNRYSFADVTVLKDYSGHNRVVKARSQ